MSIAGQSDRLNGFQIDGATNLDLIGFAGGGGFGTPAASSGVRTLSVEALRELQILSAPFDVRFGTFAGGLVNAVTRSGSNRWAGSLSGYFEDKALTGRDSTGLRAEDFSTKEFAFTLGGPIVRDRAAFFLDLGLQRDVIPQGTPSIGSDTTGGADSAGVGIRYASAVRFQEILRNTYGVEAGSFAAAPARQPSGNLFAKVTLLPAVNNRLELSHNYGHGNPEFPGDRTPYQAYALSSNGSSGPGTVNATRLTWTMARGSRLSNELNLAYLRVREEERCLSSSPYSEVVVRADESFLVAGDGFSCTVNFSNQDVWELTDNLSWFQGRASAHVRYPQRADPYPAAYPDPAAGALGVRQPGLPAGRTAGALLRERPEPAPAGGRGGGPGNQPDRALHPGSVGRDPESHPDGWPADGRAVRDLEPGEESATPVGAGDRQHAHTKRQHPLVTPARVQLRPRRQGIPPGWGGGVLRPAGVPLDQLGIRRHRTQRVRSLFAKARTFPRLPSTPTTSPAPAGVAPSRSWPM